MATSGGEPSVGELKIQLLGGFRVSLGPLAVDDAAWRWRKTRAVVKLLALSPGYRLHREQVLDRLWPDQPPETATNNLHQAMHLARRGVETLLPGAGASSWMQVQGDMVLLGPGNPLQVDADIFEAAATSALRTRALPDLESAAHLYTGELLPEDRYESWTEARREALRRLHLSLLVTLATQHEAGGNLAQAITTLEQVLASEPAHEDAHVGLMRAYALAGERHVALEQYRRLQDALQRDLDAEPGLASTALHQDIRAGRFPPGGPQVVVNATQPMVPRDHGPAPAQAPTRPQPEAAVPQGNLPVALTSFVGRERELATLRALFNTTRLLTLTGPGGGGKTRLALALAAAMRADFRDGVWWTDLAPLRDPDLVASAVAASLRVREQQWRGVLETLVDYVGTRSLLLVLDNCEHLLDPCARIADALLRAGPSVRIVATSREALGTPGELWPVPPMELPAGARPSLEESLQSEAVQLFVARARSAHPAFALTEDNAVTIAELCRRVDGLPLAIELAAARTRHLTVGDILLRLDDRFRLLVGPRTAPDRHRSLRAALDWSYDLLSDPERLLFNRLSVFPGSFTLEATEAVCAGEGLQAGDVLDALSRLIDRSLASVEEVPDGSVRYRLLETMRQYGRERLQASGESEAAFRKHRDHFLALADEADRHGRRPEETAWYQRLEVEHDNLRAALAWSFESEDAEAAARLIGALAPFWMTRNHHDEGSAWCRRALTSAPTVSPTVRARALWGSALMAAVVGDLALAERQFRESVALAREAGDQETTWRALLNLGLSYLNIGDIDRATPVLEETLVLAREAGDSIRMAAALLHLANAVAGEDFERANAMREESLALAREVGDKWCLHLALASLGRAAMVKGNYQRATELFTESRQVSQAIGDKRISALRLAPLGGLAATQGEFDRARVLFEESLAEFQRLGAPYAGIYVKEEFANALLAQGEYAQAEALCNECLRVARRAGARGEVAELLHTLGRSALLQGDADRAESLLQESLALSRQAKLRLGVAGCLTDLGRLALRKHDIEQALAHHREALRLKRAFPHRLGIARSFEGLAAVALAAGHPERAACLLGAAEALREAIGAPRLPIERPVCDRNAAAAREALGDEAFAAARAGGRTMTMEQAVEEALDNQP